MSDLIERLRAASHDERLSTGMLYREAADEIEALRASRDAYALAKAIEEKAKFEALAELDEVTARLAAAERDAERLRRIVWQTVYELEDAEIDQYPCLICGYNGPGFYQPHTHPCAALAKESGI